jgi:hypothetical protein
VLGGLDANGELERLRDDVAEPFSLARLAIRRSPLRVSTVDLSTSPWPHRINQCLMKTRNSDEVAPGEYASDALLSHIDSCIDAADRLGLDWKSRYLYVTVDTAPVEPGFTQRVPGWHFDDLQGADIPVKRPGGFLFVAASCLPTEFAIQSFETAGIDARVHNAFRWCERQIQAERVERLWDGALALISAYDVHRGLPATVRSPRIFVRLLFTHCALTSSKTTLNGAIHYDHEPHSTSGRIPNHLL